MIHQVNLLSSPNWIDYELIDSGEGQKLERFGQYVFIRPELQAMWKKTLPVDRWQAAHAVFQTSGEESGGHWILKKKIPDQWEMSYPLRFSQEALQNQAGSKTKGLSFSVMTTHGRHLGVFPECAVHWDWMAGLVDKSKKLHRIIDVKKNITEDSSDGMPNVLNLFGYTGLASLACGSAGAKVTHVDASKKSVSWAQMNQSLSGLKEKPVRWIVDDVIKFVEREKRRGIRYDGIVLDPPKFGRGPKGEIWDVYKSLPDLLKLCREILSDQPIFVNLTVYAVKLPAIHAYIMLGDMMEGFGGELHCGELVTEEKSGGRLLSQAVFARWNS